VYIISVVLLPFTRIVSGRACPDDQKSPAKLCTGGVERAPVAYNGKPAASSGHLRRRAGHGGVERAPTASSGHRRRRAGTGGVERATAASSGHRRRRAGTGGVERAPTASSGHRRRRAVTGGLERATAVLFTCHHRRTDYL
jgi:hypothetical protein